MNTAFLLFGYGVPKNILKDEQYNFYLKIAFNQIYDIVEKQDIKKPLIICSGGKTDMFKPYKRSEGGEMVRLFKQLAKRPAVKTETKGWRIKAEAKSLSTLENMVNCKAMLQTAGMRRGTVYIACEFTRKGRIQKVAKAVFGKRYKIQVIPIDFDISINRYLGQERLKEKEKYETRHALWALKS